MAGDLDRSGSEPLYRQLARKLRSELRRTGQDGAEGMTELQLRERFGVSRYTVRQALDLLEQEGLIERKKKRGTFPVARPVIEQPLEGIYTFGRSMMGLGLAPHSRVLSLRVITPTESLAGQLELGSSPGARLVELTRLRSAGEEPMVVETVWIPQPLVPGIQQLDLTGSVYDVLRDRYGLEVTSAQESIQPMVLDTRSARLLGLAKGSAAFSVQRVSYVAEKPVEVRHSLIRGDRYLYSVRLKVQSGSPLRV